MSQAKDNPVWCGWIIAPLLVIAAVLLFSNLSSVYLWQDEAATAELGARMMKYGKPLAYDGVNLLTMDIHRPESPENIHRRASDPQEAIRYAVAHGEFRADTTWTGHPWGSLLVAGVSVATFGKNTLAARAPFALAGLLAVYLFYRLILQQTQRRDLAIATIVLLLCNAYWILHSRQCRYYALTGLVLALVLSAYARWRDGVRWGALLFVAASWCYFQIDYGSFWVTMGVLFFYAAFSVRFAWKPLRQIILTGLALSALIAPWVVCYDLANRMHESTAPFYVRVMGDVIIYNQNLIALPVFLGALILYIRTRKNLTPSTRRLVSTSLLLLPLQLLWVIATTGFPFVRYQVHLVPLACFLSAWFVLELFRNWPSGERPRWAARVAFLLVLAVTPWASMVLPACVPVLREPERDPGMLLRSELRIVAKELFTQRPDPNRDLIRWIQARTQPGDEVMVTYEDIPFIFYTDLKIRGGIPAFRIDDPIPPKYAVLREAPCVDLPQFHEAFDRYQWDVEYVATSDLMWGNNPDRVCEYWVLAHADRVMVARRLEK